MVGAVEHGELEAPGVVESQVELAILGAVSYDGAGADVGLEGVEAEGDDGLVRAECGRHGALRAPVAGEAGGPDRDLSRVRSRATGARTAGEDEIRQRRSHGWEEKCSEGLHPVRRRLTEKVRGGGQFWEQLCGGAGGTGRSHLESRHLGGSEAVFIHRASDRGSLSHLCL